MTEPETLLSTLPQSRGRCSVWNVTSGYRAAGAASFRVNGKTLAGARASAIAEAFVSALAAAPACAGCEAIANFTGSSFKEILLNATASAEFALVGTGSTNPVQTANRLVEDIRASVIRAFANVRTPPLTTLPPVPFPKRPQSTACVHALWRRCGPLGHSFHAHNPRLELSTRPLCLASLKPSDC